MSGMPQSSYPRDRFDDVPRDPARVGAHRAQRPRGRWIVVLLWWLLAVGILTGGGILAFLALSNTNSIDLPDPPTASGQQTEEAVTGEIDTSYRVLVLNGTDDAAAVDGVSQSILEAGWTDDMITQLDSDATDFEQTTVYYVEADDEAAARGLADHLGVTQVTQSEEFAEMSEGGLTVVVGLDRLAG